MTLIWLIFQLTNLGSDELKVAELVGVHPGVLSKKATGLTARMVCTHRYMYYYCDGIANVVGCNDNVYISGNYI